MTGEKGRRLLLGKRKREGPKVMPRDPEVV
jgi:hypothetical protein